MNNRQPLVSDLDRWEQAANPVVSMSKEYPAGSSIAWHRHPRGQLIYASAGVMKLRTCDAFWLLPPMRGVWMPPETEHTMAASTAVSLRTLYVNVKNFASFFPARPAGIAVSALLREMLLRAVQFPVDYHDNGFEARLLALTLEEMRASSEHGINLPTGRDRRLTRLCDALFENPGDTRSLAEWADMVGATTRTLSRLFQAEIGMSFLVWRQQLRIADAVPRLLAGESVSDIAASQGYGNQSAFTVMFKRVTGRLPSDYRPRSSDSRQ